MLVLTLCLLHTLIVLLIHLMHYMEKSGNTADYRCYKITQDSDGERGG